MHAVYPLLLGALLFAVGLYGVLARRNAITVLMAIELLLNGVTVNLIAFGSLLRDALNVGQIFTLFVITIAAAETGLGLAIVLMIFRHRGSADIDGQRQLAEPLGGPDDETDPALPDAGTESDESGPGEAAGADEAAQAQEPAPALETVEASR